MSSIPLNYLVTVTPSVMTAGGSNLVLNGLLLTNSTLIDAASITAFSSYADVVTKFGGPSVEAQFASVYFSGFVGATQWPNVLYIGRIDDGDGADVAKNMDALREQESRWSFFTSTYEPAIAEKLTLGQWCAAQNGKVGYVAWDTDEGALTPNNAQSFAAQAKAKTMTGVIPVWKDPLTASLIMGIAASIDINQANGRQTVAFRRQSNVATTVTTQSDATALEGNGYNFYGAFASASDQFQFLYPGQTVDSYAWIDSFIDQLWMTQSFEGDLINLLTTTGQIPYNADGDALIEAACMATINKAVNFGAIRSGVTLSSLQQAQINSQAGSGVADTLNSRGWYFSSKAASTPADVRAKRASPEINFWYMDGQSVQRINLSSVEVQ